MKIARLSRPFLPVALALLCIGPLRADAPPSKNSDWVLVGPNKGWWKEVQIPLGYRVWLGEFGGPSVWLRISSETNVAVTVQIDNNPPQNVLKKKGLLSVDPREVLTPLYAYGDRPVYFVDDGKAAHGYAKLRIEAP